METALRGKERPLYSQAVPVRLGACLRRTLPYIVDLFNQTDDRRRGRNPSATAAGHPSVDVARHYRLWTSSRPNTATLADWEDALSTTMVELRPEFEAHWQRFTQVEQKSLRAIVEGQGATLRTHVLARLDADKSSVSRALKRLESAGEVEVIDGRTVLVDPLFALWLARLSSGVAGAEE
jgi:hypothetical protein